MKTANIIFNFYMHDLTLTSLADTIRGDNHSWNNFISSPRYLEIEKVLVRIIILVFIINSLIISFFIQRLFFHEIAAPTIAEASFSGPIVYSKNELPVTLGIQSLIEAIASTGLDPVARQKVIRPIYTVDGRIITLNQDSLEAFEYLDKETALKQFEFIAGEYTQSAWSDVYKKQIHLYVKDNVGIYYMGKDKEIIEALNKVTDRQFPVSTLF